MEPESEPQVEGTLVNDQVLITKKEMQQSLELKGYGEISKSKFFLKSFESLYLLFCEKLKLKKGKRIIDFNSLMQISIKFDQEILTKFLIYRDLRTRGYIVHDDGDHWENAVPLADEVGGKHGRDAQKFNIPKLSVASPLSQIRRICCSDCIGS